MRQVKVFKLNSNKRRKLLREMRYSLFNVQLLVCWVYAVQQEDAEPVEYFVEIS